ncbi:MAG TPA: Hsp20/alpha crystallin family protein [Gemmatimonadales bacterium]|nr:Hsp20/alpha crystallin family protein [Gemmatimonadales bacterium]
MMFAPTLWRADSLLDDMLNFRREFDRIWDRAFGPNTAQPLTAWLPAVDVHETDGEFRVTAELPGLSLEDVNVTVQNGILTISGEKRSQYDEGKEEGSYHVYERRYGRFERSFTLPRTVIADDVRATFHNGVLTITLPKTEEARPRRIQIQAGAQSDAPQISSGKGSRAA